MSLGQAEPEMPNPAKSQYTSTIWDQSFLISIVALAAIGILKTLKLLEEDRSTADTGATGGETDAGAANE
ncbi:hypothetical protein E2P81_ATG03521 [Venturia nashicola]|nr:hypothetical protein E2P81_ATG03521 [Venturia nashicola]